MTRAALMLAITLIYSACYSLIKIGLAFVPPLLFAGMRTFLAGSLLLGLTVALGGSLLPKGVRWSELIALAFTATTLTFGAMFESPGRVGAGIASVLGNTQALVTVALAAAFLGERFTVGKTVGLVLGSLGVVLVAVPALFAAGGGLAGSLLALTASGGAASGNVILKRMGSRFNVLSVTAWELLIGSMPLLGLSAAFERTASVNWNAQFVVVLLFLAVVGTALPSAVWYGLVRRAEVGRLTLFFFLVPLFGLIIGTVILGEHVSLIQVIGAPLIVAGAIPAVARATWHPKAAAMSVAAGDRHSGAWSNP